MKSITGTSLIVLCAATAVHAGLTLEINLAPPSDPWGYIPGEAVDFDVVAWSDVNETILVRGVTLDFRASSPDLFFAGPDEHDGSNPGSDGIQEFVFEEPLLHFAYFKFPNYPRPSLAFGLGEPHPLAMLEIPAGGIALLGTGQFYLPSEAVHSRYTLDALNAGSIGSDNGARLDFDFENPTTWLANQGDITGNSAHFDIIPAPPTLALVAIGGMLASHRRRVSR